MQYPKWWRTVEQIGSGTFSLTPPDGMLPGDIALFGCGTRNSSIGATVTGGKPPWREVFRYDSSSAEWHGLWWKPIDGRDEGPWELTQSGSGAVMAIVIRPNIPVYSSLPRHVRGQYRETIPETVIPKDALAIDFVIGSYNVASIVRWNEGWDLGEVKQASDEAVAFCWRAGSGSRPIATPEDGVASSQYWVLGSVWFPPAAMGADSAAR